MPSAPSSNRPSDRSRAARSGQRETWPTDGTRVFTGADLEGAVAAAVEELGNDIDVRAARSVKQGLRGKTHVEVLVAVPAGGAAGGATGTAAPRPPLPPSERSASRPAHADAAEDPVESTLAALLASAEAEEEELYREDLGLGREDDVMQVQAFEAPQLEGNPTFAAEFAAAFPAALAAARGSAPETKPTVVRPADKPRRSPVVHARDAVSVDDFTARVRDALRRVPEEQETDAELVAAAELLEAHRAGAGPHPALDLLDEPTVHLPVVPAEPQQLQPVQAQPLHPAQAQPLHPLQAQPVQVAHEQQADRPRPSPGAGRPRPNPGAALADRPVALRNGRLATAAWSRTRLHSLGVPERVLAALPHQDPTDDLRWLVALTDAIAAVIPAPSDGSDADVTASGRGLRGALALLQLGVTGVAPQTLTMEGRSVPATATELALAIRAGILR